MKKWSDNIREYALSAAIGFCVVAALGYYTDFSLVKKLIIVVIVMFLLDCIKAVIKKSGNKSL